jgi:hypothetical protein
MLLKVGQAVSPVLNALAKRSVETGHPEVFSNYLAFAFFTFAADRVPDRPANALPDPLLCGGVSDRNGHRLAPFKVETLMKPEPTERCRDRDIPFDAEPARLQDERSTSMPAHVLDISISGIRVRVDCLLSVGSEATVHFGRTIAIGDVRFCRRNRDDSFDAGLQIRDVLNIV